ncbi:MAG: P27 family phage terminase small subunit [Vicinamibacterales bacterium]
MGGKGSGGARAGAGRKPKNQQLGDLSGSRRARARARKRNQTVPAAGGNQNEPRPPVTPSDEPSTSPSVQVQIPQPPGSLTLDELAEWNDLAPRAAKEGTLNETTTFALRDLCQLRVLKDRLLRRIGDDGDVVWGVGGSRAAHPLLTRITTLSQRIEAGMARFKLAPMGKELETGKPVPVDPFAEFDQPGTTGDGDTIN